MSVLELQREDAQSDPLLELRFEADWSQMRSVHSEREVLAYSVKSDSGNIYETEVFVSDKGTICAYCSCPARVVCRHRKAVLADVLENNPEFGGSADEAIQV